MWRLIAILCLSALLTFTARGEDASIISGIVRDDIGLPLSSVMVRAAINGKSGPMVMTDADGAYALRIESEEPTVSVGFSKLGYEQEKKTVDNKTQRLDMTMAKSATSLPEVTVSNPEVRLRGDTVSFLLSAFAGKGDISLKDALRKVPGVEVSQSGEISYNGKKISNFYIEGMDLMGGKYDLATSNIPASYVNAIEILNHHKDRKIDRDIFSDNVALNVRLKPKAKIRPTGTYSASAGWGDPLPLAATGAGMLFREGFQSIITLKGSDISEFSDREHNRFISRGESGSQDYATEILGRLSASSPPLSRSRWIRPVDTSATGNFIKKTAKDATLRADIGYAFLKTEYDYADSRAYFDGNDYMVMEQLSTPETWSHKPSLSAEYRLNKEGLYISNHLSGNGTFSTDIITASTSSAEIREKERMTNFNFKDILDISWNRDKIRWSSTTSLDFNSSPEVYIDISETHAATSAVTDDDRHLLQEGSSRTLSIKECLQAMREIRRSRIFVPIEIGYSESEIKTSLAYRPLTKEGLRNTETGGSRNHIQGKTFNIGLHPEYNYTSPYDRLVVRAVIPVTLKYIDWDNTGSRHSDAKGAHLLIEPNLYINYKFSAKSTARLTASYSNTIGDITDLLTAPVMRDYMSMRYRSGMLSKRNTFNSTLHYDFKLPLSFWFMNADISYTGTRENLISRQTVGSGLIGTSDSIMPHGSDMISCNLGISKNIRSAGTKLSLKGGWSTSRNSIDQNGKTVAYRGDILYVRPSISSRPLDWLELDYEGDLATTGSRYLSRRQSFSSQRHDLGISFYPLEGLQLRLKSSFIRKEIDDDRYRQLALFDAKATYRIRKIRLSAEVRNILNRKSYSYTVMNALDRFSYDYRLRGRELVVAVDFTL